ncbi:PBECR2 nuclease fold domain-containing protein [Variovorax sp. UMC13]|uniref:PBECR2 nuclease fold domain-containing protein n=1 Tax=Variovorax sp. UMC13 TaxID=1862326 RepID=UPI00160145E9|nr:PBECR2 nuclease fold domain-containing protein [Variovorax sp. UMC13]MBB1601573.1 hypothetical protein [Variovorax sp. UMC13]
MADAAYGSLPFREQAQFFARKVSLPTSGWTDIYTREHDWAFVVAGANRDAIVSDFRGAVQKAIDGQSTLEDFRKDFDRIVSTHGWDYNGGRDWRSRVIYDTNLSTSYAAGRHEQLQAAPFWEYVHQDWVQHPRPLHQSWNGLVLAKDDPWWQTHYPPNGWGCHCEVRGLWQRDLDRMGKGGPDTAPAVALQDRTIGARSELGPRTVRVPEGIDPGFEYAPGAARSRSAIPSERSGAAGAMPLAAPSDIGLPNRRPDEPLPAPRPLPAAALPPAGLGTESYVSDFLEQFGASLARPAVARDVIGERLVVGRELFTDASGQWNPRIDDSSIPLLAHALLGPDEIWTRLEWLPESDRAVVRRTYIARFDIEGEQQPALAVFEHGQDGWLGITARDGRTVDLDAWRLGVRLYRRPDESAED